MFTLVISDRYLDWIDLPWKRGTRLIQYQDDFKVLLKEDSFDCLFLDTPNDTTLITKILQFLLDEHICISVFLTYYEEIDSDVRLMDIRKKFKIQGILYCPLLENGLFSQIFLDENRSLEQRTVALFQQLGISSSQNGYYYLKSAVKWNVRLSTSKTKLKIMQLYPILAQQYNTSVANVERNMRYVIEKAFLQGNSQMLDKLFHNLVHYDNGKVTNTEFIQSCTDYLNSQLT
ncbi:MAG: sporulation initiation factor Spo0A C-terminal domain-containing protein [Erysipelotrichaceae bacterium]|nr:sporulation initiation factor Spo0A C-terminal domain-containing protein [Erysipelotrichaceae bacterium]